MAKNYNPFKMWGSYVGLIFLFIFGMGFCVGLLDLRTCGSFISEFLNNIMHPINSSGWTLGLIFSIPGFLIGWGIHALIRRIKK